VRAGKFLPNGGQRGESANISRGIGRARDGKSGHGSIESRGLRLRHDVHESTCKLRTT